MTTPASNPTQFADIASPGDPFRFASGESFDSVQLAYKTYGSLLTDRSNVILLFPVLSTSQHAAGIDREGKGSPIWAPENHKGWWDEIVGPGKALDTNRYSVICTNYLGGCFGSFGPESINPQTGHRWGAKFPKVTVQDIVDAQVRLLDQLGIEQIHTVVGASFGGLLAYDLAVRYSKRVQQVLTLASGARLPPITRHSNLAQILAIESDPSVRDGTDSIQNPSSGLMLARLTAMRTYVELSSLEENLMNKEQESQVPIERQNVGTYSSQHPAEDFFIKHARRFSERFSAQSYLRIVGAWQSFRAHPIRETQMNHQRWLQFTIEKDSCFPAQEQDHLEKALREENIRNERVWIDSSKGHDAFLCEPEKFIAPIRAFLTQAPMAGLKSEVGASFFDELRGSSPLQR